MTTEISARSFGFHIRVARRSKKWSLNDLTDEVNKVSPGKRLISKQMLSKYELGDLKNAPSAKKRSALCAALGINEADLKEVPEERIPMKIAQELDGYDVLPLLKKIADLNGLENLTLKQFHDLCVADRFTREFGLALSIV